MDDRVERMFEEVRVRYELSAQASDWSWMIAWAKDFNMAISSLGRRVHLHLHPEIQQAAQYRRKQQQIRHSIMRVNAGNRRRQK